jgi:hypothetical protein
MSYQYPTSPVPTWPYDIKSAWKNIISDFDSGKEQRRQKNLYAKYDVSLTYPPLSLANIQILWNFYQARRGTFEAFYFYTLEEAQWNNCFVGVGDGVTTTFDIPGKSTASLVIYSGGSIVAEALYSVGTGAGDVSSDNIVFVTAPGANSLITSDFYGYMRIRCRFAEELSRQNFTAVLYRTGVKLKGIANI